MSSNLFSNDRTFKHRVLTLNELEYSRCQLSADRYLLTKHGKYHHVTWASLSAAQKAARLAVLCGVTSYRLSNSSCSAVYWSIVQIQVRPPENSNKTYCQEVFRPRLKFPGWAMPTLIFSRVGACPPCSPRAGAHGDDSIYRGMVFDHISYCIVENIPTCRHLLRYC